ncbi:MAG TPA: DUF4407 domain-containing protein [Panacibacter sp.]|nr:DUF4407 domain-containing protein [Panacibacter sp.]
MQQQEQPLSQRESYQPSAFTKFLWWLATAEKEIIAGCTIDRNRYAITGMAVLGTWLFATLAWSYFFSTVVSNVFFAVMLGIFMGGIILSIDRALIKGINSQNKRKAGPLLIRGLLALTIGTFMAQPALLYLFDKEIHVQISLDNEQKKKDKQLKQDSLYALQKNELLQQKTAAQQDLAEKYKEVAIARNNFIAETDGTGGSGKIGLKDIAIAKQIEYEKLDGEYSKLEESTQQKIQSIDSRLAAIETAKQKEQQAFDSLLNDGFLTRIEALHNLIENNSAAQFRYYLLIVILVLIELMPVIAKTLLPNGAYDEKVRLREEMEKAIANNNTVKEQSLKELYNQIAFEHDSNFIKQFFEEAKEERKEKMTAKLQRWKKEEEQSFDSIWVDLKKDFLSKQEN